MTNEKYNSIKEIDLSMKINNWHCQEMGNFQNISQVFFFFFFHLQASKVVHCTAKNMTEYTQLQKHCYSTKHFEIFFNKIKKYIQWKRA